MVRGIPPYLPASVVAREHARRRVLLLSIAALTVLSASSVFGHHLARGADALFGGTDRIGELCLVALHLLLAPVHELFHVVLLAGLLYASWNRFRAWRKVRAVLGPLAATRPEPGDPFWRAAARAGLDPRRLRIVDGLPNPAFTVGWVRPHIYVAQALLERLTGPEVVAVLAHEGAHVRRRDPLRLSVLRFFGHTLFWIPALKWLAEDVADEAEIEADDAAAGDAPLVLASAILSVVQWRAPQPRLAGVVGFTCHDILERRIRRLAGEDVAVATHVTRRSLVGALLALTLAWTSGAAVAHPLPIGPMNMRMNMEMNMQHTAGHSGDCTEHRGPAILHLFCAGLTVGGVHHRCPHYEV